MIDRSGCGAVFGVLDDEVREERTAVLRVLSAKTSTAGARAEPSSAAVGLALLAEDGLDLRGAQDCQCGVGGVEVNLGEVTPIGRPALVLEGPAPIELRSEQALVDATHVRETLHEEGG